MKPSVVTYAQIILMGAVLFLLAGALEVFGFEYLHAFLETPTPSLEVFRNLTVQIFTFLIPATILTFLILTLSVWNRRYMEWRIDRLENEVRRLKHPEKKTD